MRCSNGRMAEESFLGTSQTNPQRDNVCPTGSVNSQTAGAERRKHRTERWCHLSGCRRNRASPTPVTPIYGVCARVCKQRLCVCVCVRALRNVCVQREGLRLPDSTRLSPHLRPATLFAPVPALAAPSLVCLVVCSSFTIQNFFYIVFRSSSFSCVCACVLRSLAFSHLAEAGREAAPGANRSTPKRKMAASPLRRRLQNHAWKADDDGEWQC